MLLSETDDRLQGRRGGATVLKVGDKFCKRSQQKLFYHPPLFGQWGTKYCLDS